MSAGHLVKLGGAGLVVIAVLAVFYTLERRRRGVDVAQTVIVVLVLDAVLFPSTAATEQVGLFHPSFGGQNIRLTQVLIALALLAKAMARGLPRRVDATAMWWVAFFAWYATAAVVGLADGNAHSLVISRAYFVVEAGGMMILTATVPVREWLGDRGLVRTLRISGVIAAVVLVLSHSGTRIDAHLPMLPLLGFGDVGPDAATIFLSLGLLGLGMEMASRRRRPWVMTASVVLVIAHSESFQRATRVDLAISTLAFLVIVLLPRRRRFFVRGGEMILVGLAIAAFVATPVFVRAVSGNPDTAVTEAVPIVNSAAHVARTNYRQGSVQSRYNEWHVALPLIRESPVTGYGLGKTFTHYDIGTRSFVTFDITNNVALDLLLRTGAAGLALFVAAMIATTRSAWRAWRLHPVDEGALLAAMALAVLIGFLGKGMVESVLNEYHMTPLFGLLAGLVLSAAADTAPVRRGRRAVSGS